MKEKILTTIFGKTETGERYTFRQWLTYVWFALSLFVLGCVEDTPIWGYALLIANFAASANQLKKLPLPEDPEKDYYENEED
ncbi:MAG: hypothetical protein HDS69_02150 [Bacteroidales bacterium]|nr:hypothetical protein [Bacteroidales bacterium]